MLSIYELMSFANLKCVRVTVLNSNMLIMRTKWKDVISKCETLTLGDLRCLANTDMDLRVPRLLSDVVRATGGIDHNYCINQCSHGGLTFVAR